MRRLVAGDDRRVRVDQPDVAVASGPDRRQHGHVLESRRRQLLRAVPEGPAAAPAAGPRDVVDLFNTSASQTGDYRAKAIEALKGLLAGLPPAIACS